MIFLKLKWQLFYSSFIFWKERNCKHKHCSEIQKLKLFCHYFNLLHNVEKDPLFEIRMEISELHTLLITLALFIDSLVSLIRLDIWISNDIYIRAHFVLKKKNVNIICITEVYNLLLWMVWFSVLEFIQCTMYRNVVMFLLKSPQHFSIFVFS